MIVREVVKKRIRVDDAVFSSEEVYKGLRSAGEAAGFGVVEKEQEMKSGKYGTERKFSFIVTRRFDDFARGDILVEMKFENLNKVKQDGKELERGDVEVNMVSNVVLDVRNEWSMQKFHKMMFELYLKYIMREKFKQLYFKPVVVATEKIYEGLKEKLEYYR